MPYINPDSWDPERPRTAEEYLVNNITRNRIRYRYNRNQSRRFTLFVQRLFTVSLTFFVVTCVVAVLVGAR